MRVFFFALWTSLSQRQCDPGLFYLCLLQSLAHILSLVMLLWVDRVIVLVLVANIRLGFGWTFVWNNLLYVSGFLASSMLMPIQVLWISRSLSPLHNNKYETCFSVIFSFNRPVNISLCVSQTSLKHPWDVSTASPLLAVEVRWPPRWFNLTLIVVKYVIQFLLNIQTVYIQTITLTPCRISRFVIRQKCHYKWNGSYNT